MANYNLGRVLPIFRGEYEVGTTYNKLDVVYVEGHGSYVAKTTLSSVQPETHPDQWQIIAKDITSQEVEQLFNENEEIRNQAVQNLINGAEQDIQDAINEMKTQVEQELNAMEGEINSKLIEIDNEKNTFHNQGQALLADQTADYAAREEARETRLENKINEIENEDTIFKTQLQSSLNEYTNTKEVEFQESQQDRTSSFNSQLTSQANTFAHSEQTRAQEFTETQNTQQTTFETNEAARQATFDSQEQAREQATQAIINEHQALLELDDRKANKDGYYTELTAGIAEQILSPDGVINTEPYIYRTSAGNTSISTGVAEIKSLYGNSVVWNNIITLMSFNNRFGISGVASENMLTLNGTCTSGSFIDFATHKTLVVGHKYYARVMGSVVSKFNTIQNPYSRGLSIVAPNIEGIFTMSTEQANDRTQIMFSYGTVLVNDTLGMLYIDLSQMFGVGNEPTLELFKKWFPNDYYEYNAGEIINVNVNGLKTVGFNQYNHTTGKANVLQGNQYQITGTYTAITYSDSTAITPDSDGFFTPTKNDALIITGGNNTDTCIHLTWSGYRNGDYEQYVEHNINIPVKDIKDADNNVLFPNGLLSVGTVKDEVTSDKTIKRIGVEEYDGTEDWKQSSKSGATLFYKTIPTKFISNVGICIGYEISNWSNINSEVDKKINISKNISIDGNVSFVDKSYTSLDAWKQHLVDLKAAGTPLTVYYVLETPIEVNFKDVHQSFGDKLNLTYHVDDFGTEEFTTTEPTAPVQHKTFYMTNLRDKIRNIDGYTDAGAIMNPSFDNFLTALSQAMNGTWTKTWTNNKWSYTFTPNTLNIDENN